MDFVQVPMTLIFGEFLKLSHNIKKLISFMGIFFLFQLVRWSKSYTTKSLEQDLTGSPQKIIKRK